MRLEQSGEEKNLKGEMKAAESDPEITCELFREEGKNAMFSYLVELQLPSHQQNFGIVE